MYSDLSVFDLDHTLLKSNCSFRFGAYLYKQNFFSLSKLIRCLTSYIRHKYFGFSIYLLHQEIFKHLFKKQNIYEIQKHVRCFLDLELEQMLYLPAVQRLKEAQKKGHYTIILSSSPHFLVQPIADYFNVDEWRSSFYSQDETGNLYQVGEVMEGEQKANYVQQLIKRLSQNNIFITAYSDSYLDLPILQLAQKAIGVLPDRQLRKICIENGWEILEGNYERKI